MTPGPRIGIAYKLKQMKENALIQKAAPKEVPEVRLQHFSEP
jgi:hypothetical protein